MALRTWRCKQCGQESQLFDNEDKVCLHCGSKDVERLIGIPQPAKITDNVNPILGIVEERGIEQDVEDRADAYDQETALLRIHEMGEEEAIKAGELVSDDGGKTYRLRDTFDDRHLAHHKNEGSSLRLTKDVE